MLDDRLSRIHTGPLGCELKEGEVHVLCKQDPKGTFSIVEVELNGVVWECSGCGQQWREPVSVTDEDFERTLEDIELEYEEEFFSGPVLGVPRYRLGQVAELCRMYLLPDCRS
ncbi:MAG: hypothetical protein WCC87_11675 [Candidatus Korobacteraceae bacterium]